VKPYFELESVLTNGVFFTMRELYGVEFRERTDLPVYHPTVRVFDVLDESGETIGLFYADYFVRDSKRGGAWMDALVSQSELLEQKPVIVNVMNIPRPADGQPALISLDNVTTMFHEMGHAVHGLFSDVRYPSLAGTSVPRDFVEFPSTFHEDWAIDPKVLRSFAKHYQTGEVIPEDLLAKSIQASKFNQGFDTLEYLASALLDLAWHSMSESEASTLASASAADVEAFEARAIKDNGVDFAPVPPRYKTPFFAHVWSGGYSAGYYAYLWSEVLAADAFAYMNEKGGLTRDNGEAFKRTVLSKGGSREVMQQYIDLRGQKPTVDGLLKRRGLR
jgi:peptidyl-dipeptidase Dcp